MQMTARQKRILGGNQYLPCSSDGDGTVHRKVEDQKEEEVFWDWLREVIWLFSSYKQKTLTYWQKSDKGCQEPGGTPVLDLFLVPGPKVRANWFPSVLSQDKLTFYTTFRRENLRASWVVFSAKTLKTMRSFVDLIDGWHQHFPLKWYFYEGWWLLMERHTKCNLSYLNKRNRNNS